MTTETIETLREQASNAVFEEIENVYETFQDTGERIAEAALDAVGFEALLEENKSMREALKWYSAQAKHIGNAILTQDIKLAIEQTHAIAGDYGERARVAMKELT